MKMMAIALGLSMSAIAILTGAAQAQSAANLPKEIVDRGVLVLGTSAKVGLPYTDIKAGTTDGFIGADPELAKAIAAKFGLQVKIIDLGFDALIPSLEAGRIDMIMSGMLDTPVREEKVDFINHIIGGSAMVTSPNQKVEIKSSADICGLRVSALRGSMESTSADKVSAQCVADGKPALDIQVYPDTPSQLTALTSGRTDVAMGGLPKLSALVHTNPKQFVRVGEPFNYGPTGIAVKKGSPLGDELLAAVDQLIADGTYNEIMSRYGFAPQSFVAKATKNAGGQKKN